MAPLALLVLLAQAPPEPPLYGARGSSHAGLLLGLGGGSGGFRWAGGLDYGYFVWDGVAPGLEATVSGGSGVHTTALVLPTLRLVPVRTASMSLFLVGRAGRVIMADHGDGWAAGAGGGVILFMGGGRVGFELGFEYLRLLPASFCADLSSCAILGPQVGIIAAF
jgi:hypothetical protein